MNGAAQIGSPADLAGHVDEDTLGEVVEGFPFGARQGECREDGLFLFPGVQPRFGQDRQDVGDGREQAEFAGVAQAGRAAALPVGTRHLVKGRAVREIPVRGGLSWNDEHGRGLVGC